MTTSAIVVFITQGVIRSREAIVRIWRAMR